MKNCVSKTATPYTKTLYIIMKLLKRIFIISSLTLITIILYFNFKYDIKAYLFSKDFIFWNENIELTILDFQGKTDPNSEQGIHWFHGLYLYSKDLENTEMTAVFDKNKSWIKDTTDFREIMKKQKLQFDLCELYARKFNQIIKKSPPESAFEVEEIRRLIYNEYTNLHDSMDKPDMEISEYIKIWQPKIDQMFKLND